MKIQNLMTRGILAAALAAMVPTSAHATKPDAYSDEEDGELLLGFYESGASKEYYVDLTDLGMTTTSENFSLSNSVSHLSNDLGIAFGSSWSSQSIYMAVVGDTYDSSFTGYDLYISQPSPDVFEGQGDEGQANTDINNLGSNLNSATQAQGQESGGEVEAASTTDGWNYFIYPGNERLAGYDGGQFGSSGVGDGGISELITDSLPLAFIEDANFQDSTVTGTFSLDASGDLTYTAAGAVPEPSTFAAIGIGAVVLVFLHRRRSVA